MRKFIPDTQTPLQTRLTEVSSRVLRDQIKDTTILYDHEFESGSDDYGTVYGMYNLQQSIARASDLARAGDGRINGHALLKELNDAVYRGLLTLDYLNRNQGLLANLRVEEATVTPSVSSVAAPTSTPEQTAEFKPHIPETNEGTSPDYDAR